MGYYGSRIITGRDGYYDRAGYSVTGIGDFNGDGIEDFAITVRNGYNDYYSQTGSVYVVYGTGEAELRIDLNDIDGTNGFEIKADTSIGDYNYNTVFGFSIAGLGDVNGDGIADFGIVQNGTGFYGYYYYYGEYGYYNYNQSPAGVAYIVYGGQDVDTESVAVTDLEHFRADADGEITEIVNIGDVNGDGINDIGLTTQTLSPDSGSVGFYYLYDANGNGYYDYDEVDNPNEFFDYYGRYQRVNDITAYVIFGTDQERDDFDPIADPGDSQVIVDITNLDETEGNTADLGQVFGNNFYYYGEYEGAEFALASNSIGAGEDNYYDTGGGGLSGGVDINGDGFNDLIARGGGIYNGASGRINGPNGYYYVNNKFAFDLDPFIINGETGATTTISTPTFSDTGADGVAGLGNFSGKDAPEELAIAGFAPLTDFPDADLPGDFTDGVYVINGRDDFLDTSFQAFGPSQVLADEGAFFYSSTTYSFELDGEIITNPVVNSIEGVLGIGDFDCDGCDDMLILTRRYDLELDWHYGAYVVKGTEEARTGVYDLDALVAAGEAYLYLSDGDDGFEDIVISAAGDVNGDDKADVIIGSSTADDGNGRATVLYGGDEIAELADVADGEDDNIIHFDNTRVDVETGLVPIDLWIQDYWTFVTEGDDGPVDATFTLWRTGDLSAEVSVDWEVLIGGSFYTDANADDFEGGTLPSGTATFEAGEDSTTITVQIAGDIVEEPTEDYTVTISNPVTDNGAPVEILNDSTVGVIYASDQAVNFYIYSTSVTEGDPGDDEGDPGDDVVWRIPVYRNGNTNLEGSVDWDLTAYITASVSAESEDFEDGLPQSGTVNFAAGQTVAYIEIPIAEDNVAENTEYVTITLSNAQAENDWQTTISRSSATGYIYDDEFPVTFSANNISRTEGDAGETTDVTVVVTRSGELDVAASLDYTVQPFPSSQAADDDDIVGSFNMTGTLNFAAGETTQTIVVQIQGDDDVELDEFFQVVFSNPQADGGVETQLNTGSITGTIVNDDEPVYFQVSNASATEGNSGEKTPLSFIIYRSGDTDVEASVDYTLQGYLNGASASTAESQDLDGGLPQAGTVTFAPGETQKVVSFDVLDDSIYEQTELVELLLSNPVSDDSANGTEITDGYGLGYIYDDEIPVYLQVSSAVATEGTDDALNFVVTRSGDTSVEATVDYLVSTHYYSSADDDDLNETMPLPIGGTLTFAPGETEKIVEIKIADDNVSENTEYLQIDLSNAGSSNPDVLAVLSNTKAYGYIYDDDLPTYFRVSGSTVAEGDTAADNTELVFTIERYGDTSAPASVDYDISGGTVNADDFESGEWPTNGTVNFAANETSILITIPIAEDTDVENDEYTYIQLSNAVSGDSEIDAVIATASAYSVIDNDDLPANISVSYWNTVTEGDIAADGRVLTFTITRSGDTSSTVDVDYNFTADSFTPVSADDFESGLPQGGTVRFNPSETSKTVTFAVAEDTDIESNERGLLTLSNAVVIEGAATASANITSAVGYGVVYNDDQPPCIQVEYANGATWGISVNEGNSGFTEVSFNFVRYGSTDGTLTVNYDLETTFPSVFGADSNDIEGFLPANGLSVEFEDGQSVATATVRINGDGIIEANESLQVVIKGYESSENTDYEVKNPNTTISIRNDDGRPPIPELWIDYDQDGEIDDGEIVRVEADVFGDPHIVTLDGLGYDFQAVGEYVLVETEDGATNPFSVQVRFEPFPGSDLVSVTTRMAVEVKGKTVEVDGLDPDAPLLVDGNALDLDEIAATGGFDLDEDAENGRDIFVDEDGKIFIKLNDANELLMIGVMDGSINVCVFLADPDDGGNAGAVRGLMGNANQDLTDDFQLRDGSPIPDDAISFSDDGVPSMTFDFTYGFGDYEGAGYKGSWQLADGEALFTGDTPDFPDNFPAGPVDFEDLPDDVQAAARLAAEEAGLSEDDPVVWEAAILDFALTGDDGFVEGATQIAADPETATDTTENPDSAPAVGVSADETETEEGDTGVQEVSFTFYRTGDTTGALTVDYELGGDIDADDLATDTPLNGSISFADGEDEQTLIVLVKGDLATEDTEALTVNITGTDNEAILVSASQGKTDIITDDFGPEAEDDGANGNAGEDIVGNLFEDNGQGEDTDPDGDSLTVTLVAIGDQTFDPADGDIEIDECRILKIDPNGDFCFVTSDFYDDLPQGSVETFMFSYEVSDGNGGTDTAEVTLTIAGTALPNSDPIANDDEETVEEDVPTALDFLGNDEDPDGDDLNVTITGGPSNGTLELVEGEWIYTSSQDFNGEDTFTYMVSDGNGGESEEATVSITVNPVNDAPVGNDEELETNEDTPASINVLENDTDVDNENSDFRIVSAEVNGVIIIIGETTNLADGGLLTVDEDGNVVFDPNGELEALGFNPQPEPPPKEFMLTYQFADGAGDDAQTAEATLTIGVRGINDAPEFDDTGPFEVAENTTGAGQVTVTDVDSTEFLFEITGGADGALFDIDDASGELSFKAAPDFEAPGDDDGNNSYEIEVSVSDETETITTTVTVNVTDVDEGPVYNPVTGTDASGAVVGTDAADIINSKGGRLDTIYGLGGGDIFDFSESSNNGAREVRRIMDFSEDEGDMLELGEAQIAFAREVRGGTYLFLDGDMDIIILTGVTDYDI